MDAPLYIYWSKNSKVSQKVSLFLLVTMSTHGRIPFLKKAHNVLDYWFRNLSISNQLI